VLLLLLERTFSSFSEEKISCFVVGAEEEEWRQKVRLQSHCLANLLCSRICFLQSRESQDVLLLYTWFLSNPPPPRSLSLSLSLSLSIPSPLLMLGFVL
jgi:hypothetical protein